MKHIAFLAAFAALAAAPLQAEADLAPVKPHPVCLQSYLVDHTHVVDASTILFYMRDGKIWQNRLPAPCRGILLHGFVVRAGFDEICSNAQGITVIETKQVCQLGAFTPYTAH